MTEARRMELLLLEKAMERARLRMDAATPANPACCPDCWQRTFLYEEYEKQNRREKWAEVLRRKIARHAARSG